ncbi:MAG TPA: hypothetical protein PKN48_00145 [Bacteroidales bacterium]|nr:hypothetical protein [Bacteroidales bacterium]
MVEPYVGMEDFPVVSWGYPCKNCRENSLKNKTMLVEPHGFSDIDLPAKMVISDSAYKRIFSQNPPDSKMVLVKKGHIAEIELATGVFFIKSKKGDARFRQ